MNTPTFAEKRKMFGIAPPVKLRLPTLHPKKERKIGPKECTKRLPLDLTMHLNKTSNQQNENSKKNSCIGGWTTTRRGGSFNKKQKKAFHSCFGFFHGRGRGASLHVADTGILTKLNV